VSGSGFEAESYDLLSEPGKHRLKNRSKKPPNNSNCKVDRNFFLAVDGTGADALLLSGICNLAKRSHERQRIIPLTSFLKKQTHPNADNSCKSMKVNPKYFS
ncbi:MAG: hypothetical protein ACQESJ_07025, partial [Bacteroidota bacterium]